MKTRLILFLVIGVAVGFLAGLFVRGGLSHSTLPQATTFLRQFSMTNVLAKAAPGSWKLVSLMEGL